MLSVYFFTICQYYPYENTFSERMFSMEKDKISTTPFGYSPADSYDDGNIPKEDLPQDSLKDIIPDEVPRKDGPGGESGK